MKKMLCGLLAFVMLIVLVACNNDSKTEYHPSGFDGGKLYVNIDGNTLIYEKTSISVPQSLEIHRVR